MEAEELFMTSPAVAAAGLRNSWYRGGLTDSSSATCSRSSKLGMTGVIYRNAAKAKTELVERVINKSAPRSARPAGALNWKHSGCPRRPELTATERGCARLHQSRPPAPRRSLFLPDRAIVWCAEAGGARLYSLVQP